MVNDEQEIIGQNENIALNSFNEPIELYIPFTINGSIYGSNDSLERTFSLYINDEFIESKTITGTSFSFEYANFSYSNYNQQTNLYELNVEVRGSGGAYDSIFPDSTSIYFYKPSLSRSISYVYLMLKDILDCCGVNTNNCNGLLSLIEKVEEL